MQSRLILPATLSLVLGCDGGDDKKCLEDFDCAVDEVCRGAAAGNEGTCEAVGPDVQRTFGAADLDFTTGQEVYLLSVVAVPAGAAGGTGVVAFSLDHGGASAAALRPAARATVPAVAAVAEGRLAFERARRTRIDEISRGYREGSLGVAGLARQSAGCGTCGAGKMCWKNECVESATLAVVDAATTIDCAVVGVVFAGATAINVLLDTAAPDFAAARDATFEVARQFAATFASELTILGLSSGHSGAIDRDGDGRFTVVFTNAEVGDVDLGNIGFFDPNDFLEPGAAGATGNRSDILWARVPGTTNGSGVITPELLVGTLAHEYEHLASFALRVQARPDRARQEALWLDEGLAHLMEDLTGWGASTIANVAAALGAWSTAPYASTADSSVQRGKAFLLLRHLVDRAPGSAATVVGPLLAEEKTGLEHPLFARDPGATLAAWQLATYATGNTEVTRAAAHDHDYDPVVTVPGTTRVTGINPYATYTDARGAPVPLDGPSFVEVLDPTASPDLTDATIPAAGSLLFVVSGGTGKVSLRGHARAGDDLRVTATRVR